MHRIGFIDSIRFGSEGGIIFLNKLIVFRHKMK